MWECKRSPDPVWIAFSSINAAIDFLYSIILFHSIHNSDSAYVLNEESAGSDSQTEPF